LASATIGDNQRKLLQRNFRRLFRRSLYKAVTPHKNVINLKTLLVCRVFRAMKQKNYTGETANRDRVRR